MFPKSEQSQGFGVSMLKSSDFCGQFLGDSSECCLGMGVTYLWIEVLGLRKTLLCGFFFFLVVVLSFFFFFPCLTTVVVSPGGRAAGNADRLRASRGATL